MARLYGDLRISKKKNNKIKQMKKNEKIAKISNGSHPESVLFGATFGAKVNQFVCADITADTNILNDNLFQKEESQQTEFKSDNFAKPGVYKMAAEDANGNLV